MVSTVFRLGLQTINSAIDTVFILSNVAVGNQFDLRFKFSNITVFTTPVAGKVSNGEVLLLTPPVDQKPFIEEQYTSLYWEIESSNGIKPFLDVTSFVLKRKIVPRVTNMTLANTCVITLSNDPRLFFNIGDELFVTNAVETGTSNNTLNRKYKVVAITATTITTDINTTGFKTFSVANSKETYILLSKSANNTTITKNDFLNKFFVLVLKANSALAVKLNGHVLNSEYELIQDARAFRP